jgi:nucleoside-diphosphate-sugar epimerase
MKICVTGGAGMIGSNLVKRLVADQHEVKVIDNLWRGKLENLEVNGKYLINLEEDFFNIDLNNPANISDVEEIIKDVDVVIHLADIVAGIGYVFNKQYEIFTLNNSINTNLFRAVSHSKIKKLIYVGTACSFPLELQNSIEAQLNDEDLYPANPESAYGWSKLIGQLELRYLAEIVDFEINTLILHNVYGPNCEYEGERTQVIPSIINRVIEAKDGDTIEVWGSGTQGRAFVHVNDIVNAITSALSKSNLPEYMQIGPNYCTSIKELVETLIKISGKDLKIHFDTTKPEGDKGRFANYQIAKESIGWEPSVNLYDGLKETYEWIKSKKS